MNSSRWVVVAGTEEIEDDIAENTQLVEGEERQQRQNAGRLQELERTKAERETRRLELERRAEQADAQLQEERVRSASMGTGPDLAEKLKELDKLKELLDPLEDEMADAEDKLAGKTRPISLEQIRSVVWAVAA